MARPLGFLRLERAVPKQPLRPPENAAETGFPSGSNPGGDATSLPYTRSRGDADLDLLLCHEEERVVARDNTVTLGRLVLQIAPPSSRRSCAGLTVTVRQLDGRWTLPRRWTPGQSTGRPRAAWTGGPQRRRPTSVHRQPWNAKADRSHVNNTRRRLSAAGTNRRQTRRAGRHRTVAPALIC